MQINDNLSVPPHAPVPTAELPGHVFPVVGVGASAGGLEAIVAFLGEFPAKPGLSVVVVQHLDPKHRSQLAEILQRSS
ncbi:MAG: hypothetical protein NTX25_15685, partial [Proteobacteria bacterium]|nr:hypothetical protein [Pseudomonadota bacterium]